MTDQANKEGRGLPPFTVKVVSVAASKLGSAHHRFYTEQGEPLRWSRAWTDERGDLWVVHEDDGPGISRCLGRGRLVDYGSLS